MPISTVLDLVRYIYHHHPQIGLEVEGGFSQPDATVSLYNLYHCSQDMLSYPLRLFKNEQIVSDVVRPLELLTTEDIQNALRKLYTLEKGLLAELHPPGIKASSSGTPVEQVDDFRKEMEALVQEDVQIIHYNILKLEEALEAGELRVAEGDEHRKQQAFFLAQKNDNWHAAKMHYLQMGMLRAH